MICLPLQQGYVDIAYNISRFQWTKPYKLFLIVPQQLEDVAWYATYPVKLKMLVANSEIYA